MDSVLSIICRRPANECILLFNENYCVYPSLNKFTNKYKDVGMYSYLSLQSSIHSFNEIVRSMKDSVDTEPFWCVEVHPGLVIVFK